MQNNNRYKKTFTGKRALWIALTLLVAGSIGTRTAAQKVYTLKDCLETGLQNNYNLRIVYNEAQISKNNATPANAGYLPTVDFTAGYTGNLDNIKTTDRLTGESTKNKGVFDQTVNVGVNLNWTLFDGFNISTTYDRLKELAKQGETNTRIALEDFVASLAAEYYNFIQQKIRLKTYWYAVMLSKERCRVAWENFTYKTFSGLEYKLATVDFNADSAQYVKQREVLQTSLIRLNELMANADVNGIIIIRDSTIDVHNDLNHDELWNSTLTTNASLLQADQNTNLAMMDYKIVTSRNYPYLRLNTGYGYTFNKYDVNANSKRGDLGFNAGLTVGINLFDGNRRREKKNASLAIANRQLERQNLELTLRSDFSNLWQSYRNNLELLELERQNLVPTKENHDAAILRYQVGDISGFEMREIQKTLIDAEERAISAEYNTKICEISLLQISGKIIEYFLK